MPIDLLHFVRKWNASTRNERSAATDHFRDLCEALNVPHPTEEDEIGASYTYEKRVTKAGTGERGFADSVDLLLHHTITGEVLSSVSIV